MRHPFINFWSLCRWSIRILLDELAALYEALLYNGTPSLAPLGLQYGDYAHWQAQQAGSGLWEGQLDYWRKQLQGSPELLDLPSMKVRPKVASGRGFKVPVHISAGAYQKLQALASSLQATPVIVALAAFQVGDSPLPFPFPFPLHANLLAELLQSSPEIPANKQGMQVVFLQMIPTSSRRLQAFCHHCSGSFPAEVSLRGHCACLIHSWNMLSEHKRWAALVVHSSIIIHIDVTQ